MFLFLIIATRWGEKNKKIKKSFFNNIIRSQDQLCVFAKIKQMERERLASGKQKRRSLVQCVGFIAGDITKIASVSYFLPSCVVLLSGSFFYFFFGFFQFLFFLVAVIYQSPCFVFFLTCLDLFLCHFFSCLPMHNGYSHYILVQYLNYKTCDPAKLSGKVFL